tara:strand:+ start:409 stop:2958 length:2550 start_codon:yes stop_codon:yes gene_type:complete
MPLDFENIIALVEEVLQEKSKSEGAEQPMPKWLRSLTTDAGNVDKEFRRRQKHDTNKARSDKAALDRWQNLVTKPREQMAAKAMRDLQSRPDRIKSSEMPKKRPSAQDIRSMDAQEKLKATQRREREDIELKNIFKQLDKERALTRKSVGAFPKVATDAGRKTTAAREKLKSMQDQARWDIGKRKNLAKLKNQLSTLQKYYPNSQAREEAEEKLEIFRANLAPWESPKRVYDKKTELSTEPYSFEKGLPPEAGSAATAAMVTGKPEWAQGHLEPHSFEPRHAYKGVDWFLTSPLPAPEGGETKEEKEEREQTNRERAEERYQRWGIKPGSPEAADAVDSEASLAKRKKAPDEEKKAAPEIKWVSLKAGLAAAERDVRPLMIDVYATWCEPCKKLDKDVFPDPAVRAEAAHYVAVKVDGETPVGKIVARRYGVEGYPTVLFIDPSSGEETDRVYGYKPPAEFVRAMRAARGVGGPSKDLIKVDPETGSKYIASGQSLDVFLEAPEDIFFVVNTPQGVRYTRKGNFTADEEGAMTVGYLKDEEYLLQAAGGGHILLHPGSIHVDDDGTVYVSPHEPGHGDTEDVGAIRVVKVLKGLQAVPGEKGFYTATKVKEADLATFKIIQGRLRPEDFAANQADMDARQADLAAEEEAWGSEEEGEEAEEEETEEETEEEETEEEETEEEETEEETEEEAEEETQIPKELLRNIVNGGYKKIPGIKNEVKIVPTGIVVDKGKWMRNYKVSAKAWTKLYIGTDWVKFKNMHLTSAGGLFIEMAAQLNAAGAVGVGEEELARLKREKHEGVMYSKTVMAADEWRGLFEKLGKLEKGDDVEQCITPTGRSEKVCISFERTR